MADKLLNRNGSEIELIASNVEFDNSTSGLAAVDAQAAIDEVASGLDTVNVVPSVTTGHTTAVVTLADGSTVDLKETVIAVSSVTGGFKITKEDGTDSTVTFAEIDSSTPNPKMTVSLDGTVIYTQPINKNDIQIDNAGSDFDLTDDELSFVETNGDTATISFAKYNVSSATLSNGDITISQNGSVLATISQNADGIAYDNATSGLTATDTQAAIDEVVALVQSISVDQKSETFTATAGQTSFTIAAAAAGEVVLSRNGVVLATAAATVSGTTVTYVPAANDGSALVAGDRISIVYHEA